MLLPIAVLGQDHFLELKRRFHEKFDKECNKFPFVKKFQALSQSPNGRYIVYKFSEDTPRRIDSGWGDKVAGLVHATALAVRFNRTLLIDSCQRNGLYNFFKPYGLPHSVNSLPAFPHGMRNNTLRCLGNDKPDRVTICSMVKGDVPEQVLEFWGHREYICRWEHEAVQVMRENLGVQASDDLNQVAGCLNRLAMWPTRHLWTLTQQLYSENTKKLPAAAQGTTNTANSHSLLKARAPGEKQVDSNSAEVMQIGVHVRCGQNSDYKDQPQCLSGPNISKETKSRGGPLEMAKLTAAVLEQTRQLVTHHPLVLLSADDTAVANQMADYLRAQGIHNIWIPDKGCQIDFDSSYACLQVTVLGWFALSLSDRLVVQRVAAGLNYPPSGFSRSAASYGFTLPRPRAAFHVYGQPGNTSVSSIDSRVQQMNWFC